ncbi:hypothetical protein FHX37_1987 [Haloactinospora alba]|uniref:Uncharacterized protein n=1 Tax=Haloactinospora alba TaxID=405555 RepID=A0A543NJT3_9ACTN|nr:hypothetical protein [Haloactinospora alba]TQN32062.1 hypothetical protein FHX37_1987 [Haloactinospora alba]
MKAQKKPGAANTGPNTSTEAITSNIVSDASPYVQAAVYAVVENPVPAPPMPRKSPERRYRKQWARHLLATAEELGEVPEFGSIEWGQLPSDDLRKQAAAIRTAEAYAEEGDDLEYHLAVEDYERRRVEEETWRQYQDRVRPGIAARVIERSRGGEFRKPPHAGVYTGGPVAWEPGGEA